MGRDFLILGIIGTAAVVSVWWLMIAVRPETRLLTPGVALSDEYEGPGVTRRVRANLWLAYLWLLLCWLATGAVLVGLSGVVGANGTLWGVGIVFAIHVSTATLFPTVVAQRPMVRLLAIGCLLWVLVTVDLCLLVDALNWRNLAREIGAGDFGELRARIPLWTLGAEGAVAWVLVRVYRSHAERMGIEENPQPVYVLILVAGSMSWLTGVLWAAELALPATAAVPILAWCGCFFLGWKLGWRAAEDPVEGFPEEPEFDALVGWVQSGGLGDVPTGHPRTEAKVLQEHLQMLSELVNVHHEDGQKYKVNEFAAEFSEWWREHDGQKQ